MIFTQHSTTVLHLLIKHLFQEIVNSGLKLNFVQLTDILTDGSCHDIPVNTAQLCNLVSTLICQSRDTNFWIVYLEWGK